MTCTHLFLTDTASCWYCGAPRKKKRRGKLKRDIHNELQTALNQAIKETK